MDKRWWNTPSLETKHWEVLIINFINKINMIFNVKNFPYIIYKINYLIFI